MKKFEIQTISLEDVAKEMRRVMSEFKEEIISQVKQEEVKLITRKQVADFFGIDISTVNNWTKKEILGPVIIEGRRLFDMNDLKDLIEISKIK